MLCWPALNRNEQTFEPNRRKVTPRASPSANGRLMKTGHLRRVWIRARNRRLVRRRLVAQVNVDPTQLRDVLHYLRTSRTTLSTASIRIPHGRGATLLMERDDVKPAPTPELDPYPKSPSIQSNTVSTTIDVDRRSGCLPEDPRSDWASEKPREEPGQFARCGSVKNAPAGGDTGLYGQSIPPTPAARWSWSAPLEYQYFARRRSVRPCPGEPSFPERRVPPAGRHLVRKYANIPTDVRVMH